jgi:hypothetical protein
MNPKLNCIKICGKELVGINSSTGPVILINIDVRSVNNDEC